MQREAEREDSSVSVEEAATSAEILASNPTPIRKISKKKKWLVVGIAAALVVGAGVNTIGGNSPFLSQRVKEQGVVFNGGQSVVKTGDLKNVYKDIEEYLDIPTLKLNNIPDTLLFDQLVLEGSNAILIFSNGVNKVYFVQKQESVERSMGINSDRKLTEKSVHNSWLSMDILIEENILESGEVEYSASIYNEKASYRLFGKMSETEFCEILMELSY